MNNLKYWLVLLTTSVFIYWLADIWPQWTKEMSWKEEIKSKKSLSISDLYLYFGLILFEITSHQFILWFLLLQVIYLTKIHLNTLKHSHILDLTYVITDPYALSFAVFRVGFDIVGKSCSYSSKAMISVAAILAALSVLSQKQWSWLDGYCHMICSVLAAFGKVAMSWSHCSTNESEWNGIPSILNVLVAHAFTFKITK